MSHPLIAAVEKLGTPRVLVLGDIILDRYLWGEAERISQEAPVILLREDRQEHRLGGAANVAHMLRGLEANVSLAGVIGSDDGSHSVRAELARLGIDDSLLCVDDDRPTTVKTRFMGRAQYRHPHQMLRVDRESRQPLAEERAQPWVNRLIAALSQFDAILISDYAKGTCTAAVVRPLIAAAREHGLKVMVDPGSGVDYTLYHGATGVTPNRRETMLATGREVRTIDDARLAGQQLVEQYGLEAAYVTLDRDGIVLARRDEPAVHLPTRPREVCDITGAGDMVLAMIGVGLAAGLDFVSLGRLANVAGGLEVEQVGVVPITRADVLADIGTVPRWTGNKELPREELAEQIRQRKQAGQRIVFTNGCFDLLHAGHVAYLEEAAREGDCLVVGLNSDQSVRRLEKAPDRPLFDEQYRARMLAALQAVDYVTIFDEATPHALLELLRPDVLVKGGTYAADEIVGREIVLGYGGEVKPMGMLPGLSTTEIVRRLRDLDRPATIPFVRSAPRSDRMVG